MSINCRLRFRHHYDLTAESLKSKWHHIHVCVYVYGTHSVCAVYDVMFNLVGSVR